LNPNKRIFLANIFNKMDNLITNNEVWSIRDAQLKEQNGKAVAHHLCINTSRRKRSIQQKTYLNYGFE